MAYTIFNELGYRFTINLGDTVIFRASMDAFTDDEVRTKVQKLLNSDLPQKSAAKHGIALNGDEKFTATLFLPFGANPHAEQFEQTK